MKTNTIILTILCFFLNSGWGNVNASNPIIDTLSFEHFYVDFRVQQEDVHSEFQQKFGALTKELETLNFLFQEKKFKSKKAKINFLQNKIQLQEQFYQLQNLQESEELKLRYRKGIDLIKLLYEKLLGLDHHFTGMQTFQNVMTLSNPHSYPAFREAKDVFEKKKNRRYHVALPSLLQTNPFISATHLLVNTFLGTGNSNEKEADFEKIACIIDFTVRMNADLSVIQNETEFLKQANKTLKEECEKLFTEYTKVIGYLVPLERCRGNDDWETLYEALNYFGNTNAAPNTTYGQNNGGQNQGSGVNRELINLEFATQRVADFILKYSSFITRGTQYYQKFDNIISTYENEDACQESLPRQFTELKFDIKTTIEKFNNTYNLPEIQGSRLKDLMYGQMAYN